MGDVSLEGQTDNTETFSWAVLLLFGGSAQLKRSTTLSSFVGIYSVHQYATSLPVYQYVVHLLESTGNELESLSSEITTHRRQGHQTAGKWKRSVRAV